MQANGDCSDQGARCRQPRSGLSKQGNREMDNLRPEEMSHICIAG
jgi:hypothetical protein